MKFCFSVCEYDPLHNGHVYHLSKMKESGADFTAVIMSGGFTQRGGAAVMDKYTRASHAIKAGADVVFELPTAFATANAEIFAKGAIKLLFSLGDGNALCFGNEYGEKEDYLALAKLCLDESKEFKAILKRELDSGAPFALARANAVRSIATDEKVEMLEKPNCILGLEYTKAIVESGRAMDILPIKREGGGHSDKKLEGKFCSSSAIREAISSLKTKNVKKYLPKFVFDDLPKTLPDMSQALLYSLLSTDGNKLKEIIDCSEGLENRIKVFSRSSRSANELIDKLETKRYTRSRLQRVVLGSLLQIDRQFVSKCLKAPLYLKVLAIARDKMNLLSDVSELLSVSKTTLITRKNDADVLSGVAKECFEKDVYANDIYNLISNLKTNEYEMKIIER